MLPYACRLFALIAGKKYHVLSSFGWIDMSSWLSRVLFWTTLCIVQVFIIFLQPHDSMFPQILYCTFHLNAMKIKFAPSFRYAGHRKMSVRQVHEIFQHSTIGDCLWISHSALAYWNNLSPLVCSFNYPWRTCSEWVTGMFLACHAFAKSHPVILSGMYSKSDFKSIVSGNKTKGQ